MKRINLSTGTLFVYATLMLCNIFNAMAQVTLPGVPGQWQLTFSDEFNGSSLDNSVWQLSPDSYGSTDIACEMGTFGNGSPGDNLNFTGSSLEIITKQQSVVCNYAPWDSVSPTPKLYTTAGIQSGQQFRYGYFEIRCKVPFGWPGVGPNFWLWGADKTTETCSPLYREIDVFEYDKAGSDAVTGNCNYNLHWNYVDDGTVGGGLTHNDYRQGGAKWITDGNFHTFGVMWTPEQVWYYRDGQLQAGVVAPSTMGSMWIVIDNRVQSVMNMNPADHHYEIDYVRLYKKVYHVWPVNTPIISSSQVWGSGYEYDISNTIVSNAGNLQVIAENNIQLQPNFFVDPGGSFEAKIATYDNTSRSPYVSQCYLLPTPSSPPNVQGVTRTSTPETANTSLTASSETASDITVAPNPTTGKFQVFIPSNSSPIAISVTNLLGDTVYESTLTGPEEINLNTFPGGIYLLRYQVNGVYRVQKIVLNK